VKNFSWGALFWALFWRIPEKRLGCGVKLRVYFRTPILMLLIEYLIHGALPRTPVTLLTCPRSVTGRRAPQRKPLTAAPVVLGTFSNSPPTSVLEHGKMLNPAVDRARLSFRRGTLTVLRLHYPPKLHYNGYRSVRSIVPAGFRPFDSRPFSRYLL